MAKTPERSVDFFIATASQRDVEDKARDLVLEEKESGPVEAGFVTASGEITSAGWSQLNDDLLQLERNCLKWLREKFVTVRDEGHDRFDNLVGTLWYNPRSSTQRHLIEIGTRERIDFVDLSYGDLADSVWEGISRLGATLLDGSITFQSIDE